MCVKYSKCQDLPKFKLVGGGGGGCSEVKYSKCQDLPKFQFSGGGGRYSGTRFQNRGVMENLDKNLLFEVNCTETCLCITDSLSHVETKQ